MCGIVGFINGDASEPADRGVLARMRDSMTYRGPDEAGAHFDGPVALGHRRLSIIDLATGQQPMCNEDGSVWIVFNGEVFNYVELRRQFLDGSRHRVATTSDTEVMVHLYEEFGDDCVRHFNGMFAFAIWDAKRRRLLLGRDRLGVKPLYWTEADGTFLFASEIKGLLAHPKVRVRVDPVALDEFFTFGYTHTPRTLFAGIHKLPEGHTLAWQDGKVTIRQYWDLDFTPNEGRSEAEHLAGMMDLLHDSLRLRLRADVPLGVFLSGGVDSSAVVGLLAKSVGKIKTFSIGFEAGREFNELEHARAIAKRYDTDHHEMILQPAEFRDFIPRFIEHMDEPVTEGAAISLYFVSELAGRHVEVVLSGEGADELFAGYPAYPRMLLLDRYRKLPSLLRRGLLGPLIGRLGGAKLARYAHLAEQPLERRYLGGHLYDIRERDGLYSPGFHAELSGHDPLAALEPIWEKSAAWDPLSRMLYLDTKTWLPNDILIKADRMSMAASIELRVPFLDYRLVEYAASVPSRFKLRGAQGKYLLKKAVRDLLPKNILHRRKMGFPTPLAWMFRHYLNHYLEETLLDRRALERGYFDATAVRRYVTEHVAGQADHHQVLWRLLIVEEWHRRYVDRDSSEHATATSSSRELVVEGRR